VQKNLNAWSLNCPHSCNYFDNHRWI
jgi:hypothetical protein